LPVTVVMMPIPAPGMSEDTSGAVACATRCPDASTPCHVRLDQLVGHSNPSSAGSGTLGDLGAQPDGGEGRLDGYLGSFLIHLPELGFRVVDVLTDVVGGGFSAVDYRLEVELLAEQRVESTPEALLRQHAR
jgi:hypothetical protein